MIDDKWNAAPAAGIDRDALAAMSESPTGNDADRPGDARIAQSFMPGDSDAVGNQAVTVPAVAAPNVAPVIDLNGAASGKTVTIGYTVGGGAVAITPGATVTDNSTSFASGTLTVALTANGTTSDRLTIENQGNAAGQIGVSGANVSYGGTVIGTFIGGTNGANLVISFNAASSPAAAQALTEHILYASTANNALLARTVNFTLVDGGGTAGGGADTDSATATIYSSNPYGSITPGDIVVYRVGDGSTALTASAAPVYLDEYTKSGTFVQTIMLPVAGSGANRMLTTGGTAVTGGVLGRSLDFHYLLLSGLDTAPGSTNPLATQASSVNRVVGRVDAAGSVDTATALANAFSNDNIRGVASIDGSAFYIAGGGGTVAQGGVQYAAFHAGGSTQIATGDYKSVTIDGGQVYADSTGGIFAVGSGLPTGGSATTSLGVALSGAHEYVLLDRDTSVAGVDTLYVAEDNALLKFGLVGGVWTAEGSIATGLLGLDATVASSSVTFFATTAATFQNPGGNAIVTFTDTAPYNAPISVAAVTTLATAAANTGFRGLSFAPSTATISVISAPQAHYGSHTTGQSGGTFTFDLYRESAASAATVQYAFTSNDFASLSNQSGTATFAAGSLRTTVSTTVTFTSSGGNTNEAMTLTLSNPSDYYTIGAGGRQVTLLARDYDYPVIDLNGSAAGFSGVLTYSAASAPVAIAPAATVADPATGFAEKSLTVAFTANGTAADQLTIRNQGSAAGQIGVSGTTVSYGGAAIGTVGGGVNGAALVITFTPHTVTTQIAQALAEQVLYSNTSSSPSTAARTVAFSLVDEGGTPNNRVDTGTTTATIAINAAPALDLDSTAAGTGTTATALEGQPVAVAPNATLSDSDSANFDTGSLTVSYGAAATASDFVSVRDQGGQFSPGRIGVNFNTIYYDRVAIGTFTAGLGQPLVVTFNANATPVAAQALLHEVLTGNVADAPPSGARALTFTVNDGDGGSSSATADITVSPVNDAPTTAHIAGDVAIVASTYHGYTLIDVGSDATIADVDSANFDGGSLHVALTAGAVAGEDELLALSNDTISFTGGTNTVVVNGVTIGRFTHGADFLSMDFSFNADATPAAAQEIIRALNHYHGAGATLGDRTVSYTLVDGGGGTDSVSFTSTIRVAAPANAAPALDLDSTAAGTSTTATALEGQPVAVAPNATLSDSDSANFDTGSLTVSYGATVTANDFVSVRDQGGQYAPGRIGVNFNTIYYGTAAIGTFTAGLGQPLVVTFNANATPVAVQALLHEVLTGNVADAPPSGARALTFTVNDGDGGSTSATADITVSPVNDAPTIANLQGDAAAYTEDANTSTRVDVGTNAVVNDPDSGNFNGGSLTASITSGFITARDRIGIFSDSVVTVSGNNVSVNGLLVGTVAGNSITGQPTLVLTFTTDDATPANVQEVVRHIFYGNGFQDPVGGTRGVTLTLVDGDGTANGGTDTSTYTSTINVVAVNDAPVNTVPGAQTLAEDATTIFNNANGNRISVADVDAGSSAVQVTVGVAHGNLTLSGVTGLTFAAGDGTADGTMTFTGTLSNVNTALNGMTYRPTANYNGADTLTITTNDLGNSGTGGSLSDTDTVAITITPVNDAPSGTDASIAARHGTIHVLTLADFGFSDVEGNAFVAVTIDSAATAGRLLLANGNGTRSEVVAGQTIAAADIAAGKLIYKPTPGMHDAATGSVTFSVKDDGGTANGGVDTDASPNTLTFFVPPNGAPQGTDATLAITPGVAHVMTAQDFGFTDNDGDAFSAVTISSLPTGGRLLYIATPGGPAMAVALNQVISADDIAAGKLVYKLPPAANASGGSFTFQVHDDGDTDNGGVDIDPTPNTIMFNATGASLAGTAQGHAAAEMFAVQDGHADLAGAAGTGGIALGFAPASSDGFHDLIRTMASDAAGHDLGALIDTVISGAAHDVAQQTIDDLPFDNAGLFVAQHHAMSDHMF